MENTSRGVGKKGLYQMYSPYHLCLYLLLKTIQDEMRRHTHLIDIKFNGVIHFIQTLIGLRFVYKPDYIIFEPHGSTYGYLAFYLYYM